MLNVLTNINFELLVLVGDIYQIESITFGNWFGIAKMLMDDKIKFELTVPYRSKNENLKVFLSKGKISQQQIYATRFLIIMQWQQNHVRLEKQA